MMEISCQGDSYSLRFKGLLPAKLTLSQKLMSLHSTFFTPQQLKIRCYRKVIHGSFYPKIKLAGLLLLIFVFGFPNIIAILHFLFINSQQEPPMNNYPKCLLFDLKLLKQQPNYLLRSKSHYFYSQLKSSRSPSSPKSNYKLSQLTERKVKNTKFSSYLFNQAHKIDPVKQTYLPTRRYTPSNTTKIKTILIHCQKSQRALKNSKISKTKSLYWNTSNMPDQINEKKQIEEQLPNAIVPLSSLTELIMNQCKVQTHKGNPKANKRRLLTTDSESVLSKKGKKQDKDNPYELLPLKKANRRKQSRIKPQHLED